MTAKPRKVSFPAFNIRELRDLSFDQFQGAVRPRHLDIANLARIRSSVMAVVPGGGSPSIVATMKRPTINLSSTAPVLISSAKCFRNDLGGAFTMGGIGTATFGAIIFYQILAWKRAEQ